MPVNRVKEYTLSVTAGAVVNIIGNLFLIEPYSANGAAIATVISEFAVTAVQLYFVRTTISRRMLFKDLWRYLLSGLIMYFVVLRLDEIMKMNIINLAAQVVIGAVVYLLCILVFRAPIVERAKQILTDR